MLYRIAGLIRDLVKAFVKFSIQVRTRLCHIERLMPSSVSLSAVLDVIPQGPYHEKHKLVMDKRAFIEKWCVVNTWHGDVILGSGSGFGIGSIVIGPVTVKKGSRCSQNCFISGQSHRFKDISTHFLHQGFDVSEVVIEEDVWIGSNCVVLAGVRIGRNSVVGAGAIVTKDIPPYSVAVGNPARVIRRYVVEEKRWIRV